MRIACVNMQKNEAHCLEPWVQYHGHLFGFENLFIIDHCSDAPKTVEALKRFEANGVSVVRLPKEANYQDKGLFVATEIQRIEKLTHFDFVFPIDCDEFLFLRTSENTVTCERTAILRYLERFRGFKGILKIKENLLHILGQPGYFWSQPYQKVFFASGECVSLDHGSHIGEARSGDASEMTDLAYAHFHFKPYRIDQELSREKLRPWVDVNDLEAVRSFEGPGSHLKGHLLASEEEYYSGFRVDQNAIYFDELVKLFNLLGIDPNFSAYDTDGRVFSQTPSTPRPVQMLDRRDGNIAPGKSTSQSSVAPWSTPRSEAAGPAGAIDGHADGTFGFHTEIEDLPWWMVDLETTYGIQEIRLFNRIDNPGIARRTSRLAIEIGLKPNHLIEVYRRETDEPFGGIDGNPLIFHPSIPIPGRFVRIRLLTRNYLHLDQVEVYGDPLPSLGDMTLE